MNIIDCTLRDGGYKYNFDWNELTVKNTIDFLLTIPEVTLIEIGYYQQGGNRYFNLSNDDIKCLIEDANKVCVMIDFWNCKRDLKYYVNPNFGHLRLATHKNEIEKAIVFLEEIKDVSGAKVYLNLIHFSEYTIDDIKFAIDGLNTSRIDVLYVADSYGTMNLVENEWILQLLTKELCKPIGFHLHAHTGTDILNYFMCKKYNIQFMDVTLGGIGKGSGNLPLECVSDKYESIIKFSNEHFQDCRFQPHNYICGRKGIHI